MEFNIVENFSLLRDYLPQLDYRGTIDLQVHLYDLDNSFSYSHPYIGRIDTLCSTFFEKDYHLSIQLASLQL